MLACRLCACRRQVCVSPVCVRVGAAQLRPFKIAVLERWVPFRCCWRPGPAGSGTDCASAKRPRRCQWETQCRKNAGVGCFVHTHLRMRNELVLLRRRLKSSKCSKARCSQSADVQSTVGSRLGHVGGARLSSKRGRGLGWFE